MRRQRRWCVLVCACGKTPDENPFDTAGSSADTPATDSGGAEAETSEGGLDTEADSGDDSSGHDTTIYDVGGGDAPSPTDGCQKIDFLFVVDNCMAKVGLFGSGAELPMDALVEAVTTQSEPGGCNGGFLRPDAVLVTT